MSRKNLIVLEHAENTLPINGCTVLLRGGSVEELCRVKRVLKRMLLMRQHAKYEKAFLLTEYCQIDGFKKNIYDFQRCDLNEMTLTPFVRIPPKSAVPDLAVVAEAES